MTRSRYWLVAALLLATACGSAAEDTQTQAEGIWLLESYTTDKSHRSVEIGNNTGGQPWIQIGEVVQGNLGCNDFGWSIRGWWDDELRINPGWSTSMLCTDSMEVEELLRDVMANPVQVEVGGDIMLWRSSDTELTFRSSPTPPETPWQIRERESNILGVWLLESYRTAAGLQHIEIGVNAAEQPWVEVDDATISGSAGCNGFGTAGDGYRFDGETLSVDEGYLTASLCVGDDGTDVMQAETALRDLLWQIPSEITVKVRGDSMTWSAGGVELRFFRTTAPPGPPTTQPPQSFGKLDCSPGHVDRVVIDDTTRDAEQILRDEVPKVVRTEEDREFTDPSPEGWFWLGYDAQDNPIAFIARGDIEPPKYELFTCSEQ